MEILSFPHLQNSYKRVIKNCIFCQFGNARQVYRHPSIWQEVSTYHGVNIRIQFSAVFISKVSLILRNNYYEIPGKCRRHLLVSSV